MSSQDEQRQSLQFSVTRILIDWGSLEETAQEVLRVLCEQLGWQAGAFWLVNSQGVLSCVAFWRAGSLDVPEFEAISRSRAFASGGGLPGRIWMSSEPACSLDLAEEDNSPRAPIALREGIHGACGFPILAGKTVVGVVELFSHESRQRDDELLEMLTDLGRPIGHFIERKRAEEALRMSEEGEFLAVGARLRMLVDTAHDAFVGMDADGIIVDWNPQAERTFGWSSREAVGRSLAKTIIPAQHREAHERGLRHFLTTGEGPVLNKRFEITALHREGREFPVEITISAFAFGATFLFYAFLHDISERKKSEAEIRKLNEELEQRVLQAVAEGINDLTAANQELEAFSYSISHDLRAPLRHIVGYVDLLRDRIAGVLDEKSERYIETIRDSAKHMGDLIDDLLTFSRIGRAEIERSPVNLGQLLNGAFHDLQEEIERRNIRWTIAPLPDVNVDHALLRSVLVNLISNALKFTRSSSPVEIEIGCVPGKNETVFFVRDNGVGFDMKYVHKLFGVFQRLHRAEDFEGTGIGLANVQRIIQRHGGRTWAESSENQGATFFFSLPV